MKANPNTHLPDTNTPLEHSIPQNDDRDFFRLGISERRVPLQPPLISRLPVAAFCCDLEGAVASHNEAAAALWGRVPDSAAGAWCGAHAIFGLDGVPLLRCHFPAANAVACGHDLDAIEVWLERPDGSRRRVEVHPKLLRSAAGTVAGALCLLVDNTERERLSDELARNDSDRNEFLTLLAHELRNPLSPILSAASIMKKDAKDERIFKMASVVERQVKLLSRFVSDLLDAPRLTKDGIALRFAPSTLGAVIDGAVDVLAAKARSRGQCVTVDLKARNAAVMCDPERVSQALANVLLNASEFTNDGGCIALRVEVDGALVEAEVEDNGIGIPAEHIGQIFERYAQFSGVENRMRSGVGLGLAISKEICERHGGLITVSSGGRDKGSRFRIILPIAAAHT